MNFPQNWSEFFNQEQEKIYFKKLIDFIEEEYQQQTINPLQQNLFKVFELINPEDVKVIILGQDPYPKANQANGIAFSAGTKQTPLSLQNIFKELKNDLNIDHFDNNDLSGWVKQGVFLINTIWTVKINQPLSHKHQGWETFTQNLLVYLVKKSEIIFCAFGNNAYNIYSKISLIEPNSIIHVGHPSPLSYHKYFQGSRPFTKINQKLLQLNLTEIDWSK